MKIKIKKLQGGECTVEVAPTTTIKEIKLWVAEQLKIPASQQKLLFLGRPLVDDKTIKFYHNLKEGSKLNLIVKKEKQNDDLYDSACRVFKNAGLTDIEAIAKAKIFIKAIEERFNSFSWDDIEKLCADCSRVEGSLRGDRRVRASRT